MMRETDNVMGFDQANAGATVVVMFGDQTGIKWLRFLRRGFRHCFACFRSEQGWVLVDPLSHYLRLVSLPPITTDDLEAWYREQGYRVIVTTARAVRPKIPLFKILTCVELIKHIIGINNFWLITPHQLYIFLKK